MQLTVPFPEEVYKPENRDQNFKSVTVMLKYVDDIFLHVGDISIGHQHHDMPECDVGDRYVMLET